MKKLVHYCPLTGRWAAHLGPEVEDYLGSYSTRALAEVAVDYTMATRTPIGYGSLGDMPKGST